MLHHPKTMTAPGKVTARTFFGDLCPRLLEKRSVEGGARFGFVLSGDEGGAWTIDLAQKSVVKGTPRDVDVAVEMTATDFMCMLAGELDTLAAYRDGALRVTGDVEKLAILGTLFRLSED